MDADYAHKDEERRWVSGVIVRCGGTLVSWVLQDAEVRYVAYH